mgnify:CR=1 FL=1
MVSGLADEESGANEWEERAVHTKDTKDARRGTKDLERERSLEHERSERGFGTRNSRKGLWNTKFTKGAKDAKGCCEVKVRRIAGALWEGGGVRLRIERVGRFFSCLSRSFRVFRVPGTILPQHPHHRRPDPLHPRLDHCPYHLNPLPAALRHPCPAYISDI